MRQFFILLFLCYLFPFITGFGRKDTLPKMISVEGGVFKMGDDWKFRKEAEKPVHTVIVHSFKISKYPITVAQYRVFCEENDIIFDHDRRFKGMSNHPVTNVNWHEALAYTSWLSDKTGKNYRLPTEAEWEFAARGGLKSKGYKFSGSDNLDRVGWYNDNSSGQTHAVGTKKANELGIYDMSGNIWEWCNDWYAEDYYNESPEDNPKGPDSAKYRVVRGGSWFNNSSNSRVAKRNFYDPNLSFNNYGFRVVLVEE
ncbi:MAG TPA: formylglycine-generating enzyme family protein [Edaphocola sp.]|nr:formylglycine-generating enzyme family protein [Edaphocola sp.]